MAKTYRQFINEMKLKEVNEQLDAMGGIIMALMSAQQSHIYCMLQTRKEILERGVRA